MLCFCTPLLPASLLALALVLISIPVHELARVAAGIDEQEVRPPRRLVKHKVVRDLFCLLHVAVFCSGRHGNSPCGVLMKLLSVNESYGLISLFYSIRMILTKVVY